MTAATQGLLAGKTAVITGSTQGLGFAIAQAYVGAGAQVVISNHRAEDVARAETRLSAPGARACGVVCDVREREQVWALAQAAVAAYGGFDIWVNNAGVVAPRGPTAVVDPEAFSRVVHTNILGVYHGSLAALQHFRPRHAGKLINVVGRGERRPNPFGNAYGASKAWIRNFTLALAAEERASGIGIFTLNPGLLDTEITRRPLVVSGYEHLIRGFGRVARWLAAPPEAPALLALHLAGPATDGRTGIEARQAAWPQLLRALLTR
jgi:glucose 1-dehydrogenase